MSRLCKTVFRFVKRNLSGAQRACKVQRRGRRAQRDGVAGPDRRGEPLLEELRLRACRATRSPDYEIRFLALRDRGAREGKERTCFRDLVTLIEAPSAPSSSFRAASTFDRRPAERQRRLYRPSWMLRSCGPPEEADDHGTAGNEDRAADAVEAESERDVCGDDDPDQVDREEIPASEPGFAIRRAWVV